MVIKLVFHNTWIFYPVSLIQNKLHSTIQKIQQIKAELRRYLFLLCACRKH